MQLRFTECLNPTFEVFCLLAPHLSKSVKPVLPENFAALRWCFFAGFLRIYRCPFNFSALFCLIYYYKSIHPDKIFTFLNLTVFSDFGVGFAGKSCRASAVSSVENSLYSRKQWEEETQTVWEDLIQFQTCHQNCGENQQSLKTGKISISCRIWNFASLLKQSCCLFSRPCC